jgi:hypothetical protein
LILIKKLILNIIKYPKNQLKNGKRKI